MSKLSYKEIDQAHDDIAVEDFPDFDLQFIPAEHDECVEEPYDYSQDDWLFDDYYHDLEPEYDDRYYDPYPYEGEYL